MCLFRPPELLKFCGLLILASRRRRSTWLRPLLNQKGAGLEVGLGRDGDDGRGGEVGVGLSLIAVAVAVAVNDLGAYDFNPPNDPPPQPPPQHVFDLPLREPQLAEVFVELTVNIIGRNANWN